ncbi:hypothetical protein [Dechloromonas sp. A34]|uniref:hypothetical protein n=1 Tax=Dechloromonas sp. A34 TaxID=447588 RepID=UPI00224971A6|nr:hypothetical protein [Dechloromonas sp. A34]
MVKTPIRNKMGTGVPAEDEIEQHFIDAFARLQSGKPKDKGLQTHAKRGTLRITVTSVAKEAGHSRTLIGHKGCRYPNVRDRVMALKSNPDTPTRMQDVVTKRREEAAKLRRQLALAQTQNATLLARVMELNAALSNQKRKSERLQKGKPTNIFVIPTKP